MGIDRAHRLSTLSRRGDVVCKARAPEKVSRWLASEVQPEPYRGGVWEYLREALDEPEAVRGILARAVVGVVSKVIRIGLQVRRIRTSTGRSTSGFILVYWMMFPSGIHGLVMQSRDRVFETSMKGGDSGEDRTGPLRLHSGVSVMNCTQYVSDRIKVPHTFSVFIRGSYSVRITLIRTGCLR